MHHATATEGVLVVGVQHTFAAVWYKQAYHPIWNMAFALQLLPNIPSVNKSKMKHRS